MSWFSRKFNPSFGRQLLSNTDCLPRFSASDRLTHDGKGKRLLPETKTWASRDQPWAVDHAGRFVRKCIMAPKSFAHHPLDPVFAARMEASLNPSIEPYTTTDAYRVRLFTGIALIDAVRANNVSDDSTIDTLFLYYGFDEERDTYLLKNSVNNAALYTQAVDWLNGSDLYF